jgi:phage tail protein X
MATTTPYITNSGDRWDTIANKAYGDVTKMKEIIEANPDLALVTEFDEGITILLPIIAETETQAENLPPWKR